MNVIVAFLVGLTVELGLYMWLFRVYLRQHPRQIVVERERLSAPGRGAKPRVRVPDPSMLIPFYTTARFGATLTQFFVVQQESAERSTDT